MQSRVIPAANRRRPKSRTKGDAFPESPGGNGVGPDVVRSVIFPGRLHRLIQAAHCMHWQTGWNWKLTWFFRAGHHLSGLMIITGSLSTDSQGLKKTYLKLKIAQETRLLKGFLGPVRYLI